MTTAVADRIAEPSHKTRGRRSIAAGRPTIIQTQSASNNKTGFDNNATRATIDNASTAKYTQVNIMYSQGPTNYKTLQAINEPFQDQLKSLVVIRVSWSD